MLSNNKWLRQADLLPWRRGASRKDREIGRFCIAYSLAFAVFVSEVETPVCNSGQLTVSEF